MTRLEAVRRAMVRRRIPALVITRPLHVSYASGAQDCAWALVVGRQAWLLPFGLGADAAKRDAAVGWTVLPPAAPGGAWSVLATILERAKVRCLGFEADVLPGGSVDRLRAAVRHAAVLRPVSGLLEPLRAVKEPAEVAAIGRAAAVTARVAGQIPWMLADGITEREAAARVDIRMRALGADGPAFETILLFGERTALPHGHPGGRRLRAGDLILADFGARLGGWHSDCTRVWAWRRAAAWQRAAYARVAAAYAAGRHRVRAGRACGDADGAARRALGPYERRFIHSLGHGVGLEIHEHPRLARGERDRLASGMVVTVEPGVYLPGRGGVRLEDTVVVGRGPARSLTGAPAAILPVAGV